MNQNQQTIAAAFDRLFRTYPQSDRGADADLLVTQRMERAKVYFEAVAPYELQDVMQAIENFITGNVPGCNAAFAPPAPHVAAECRRVMNLRLNHEKLTRKPLPPPADREIPDDERERVKAKFAKLKASLPVSDEETDKAAASKARSEREIRWLRDRGELVELPGSSVPISTTLLRQFEVGDSDGDRDVA